MEVRSLVHAAGTTWHRLRIRSTERGELCDAFAARRVWSVHDGQAIPEWLVMRKERSGKYLDALSNAPKGTALRQLAWWKCQRDFVERSNQDAKSELGWEVEVLPMLSVANIRSLLRAVLPLPQLTPEEATQRVIQHVLNRVHSRRSRLKHAANQANAPPPDGYTTGGNMIILGSEQRYREQLCLLEPVEQRRKRNPGSQGERETF